MTVQVLLKGSFGQIDVSELDYWLSSLLVFLPLTLGLILLLWLLLLLQILELLSLLLFQGVNPVTQLLLLLAS